MKPRPNTSREALAAVERARLRAADDSLVALRFEPITSAETLLAAHAALAAYRGRLNVEDWLRGIVDCAVWGDSTRLIENLVDRRAA